MTQKLDRYIRAYRKQAGLTQADLGALLGFSSGEQISRLERSIESPTIGAALLLSLIFDRPLRQLLPGMRRALRTVLNERAQQRLQLLDAQPSTPRNDQRRLFLRELSSKDAVDRVRAYDERTTTCPQICCCGYHPAAEATAESANP